MPSISFVLKEPKVNKKTPIFLLFRMHGKRIKISTKESIEPEFWNKKKQNVRPEDEVLNYQEINNNLTKLYDNAIQIYKNLLLEFKREPSVEELKTAFNKKLFDNSVTEKSKKEKGFFEFFEDFIIVREQNRKVSAARIRNYKRTLNTLREYQEQTNNLIAFERFDEKFSISFRAYLEDIKNYSANTIKKEFKIIRTVLNNAYAKNYTINREYKLQDFMPEGEDSFEIALTLEELEALYQYDFSKNKRLEKTRDLFLVGCYTGLRFSDFSRLGKDHIQGKFLSIVPKKTKNKNPLPVIIPILEPVKQILEKYNYRLPKDLSNQKMNQYLKEMAEESELFEDTVTYYKTKGGKKVKISHPRYNEIVTHTARRTYCTVSYKLGVPTQSIMKISGHRTEASFLRYLKVSSTDHADRTLKIWEAYYLNNKKDISKSIELKKVV